MNNQRINTSTNSERTPGDDPTVTQLLRHSYAPPSDTAYWAIFEQRLLIRLRESGPVAWWAVFSEWRSAGMVAAAIALIIAGAAVVREQRHLASMRDVAAAEAVTTVFENSSDEVTIPPGSTTPRTRISRPAPPDRYTNAVKP